MRIDSDRDFGTRECPSCATEVSANHNYCPICQYPFPQEGPLRYRLKVWGTILLLIVLFLFLVRTF